MTELEDRYWRQLAEDVADIDREFDPDWSALPPWAEEDGSLRRAAPLTAVSRHAVRQGVGSTLRAAA